MHILTHRKATVHICVNQCIHYTYDRKGMIKIHSQIGKCNKWVHVDSVAWDEFLWFLPFYPNHITSWHHTFIPKAYLGQTPIWSSRMANIYLALQDDFITSLDLTTVLLLALFWLWPFTPCKGVFWLWFQIFLDDV